MTAVLDQRAELVRDFEREDVPSVARLFVKAFRKGKGELRKPASGLLDTLNEIYFDNPWYDSQIASKVFVDADGSVRGFIGVTTQLVAYEGKRLRVAYAGSLTVEEPERYPLAGARLLRAFLAGPQDISVTETANSTALRMWQKLGIPSDTAYSLNWMRIFRPFGAGVAVMAHRSSAAGMLSPLARFADRCLASRRANPFRMSREAAPRRLTFQTTDRAAFDAAALRLCELYPLRPLWDETSIDWFSSQAAIKRKFGDPCYRVAYGRDGAPVAAYVYFRRCDDLGWLLQSLVRPEQAQDLVDDLLHDAMEFGCVGVRGAAQPWLNNALLSRRTLFLPRMFYLVHTRDKALLEPFRQGVALASGLAGESWMRLIGDDFRE